MYGQWMGEDCIILNLSQEVERKNIMTKYDRTFCSNTNCKDKNCRRNQNNFEIFQKYISISDFPECEKFPKYKKGDEK